MHFLFDLMGYYDSLSYISFDSNGQRAKVQGHNTMKTKTYTVGLRKPTLGSRVLHLTINNRAWLKKAMSKPIVYKGAK